MSTEFLLLTLFLLLLIVGMPLGMATAQHIRSTRMAQPVIRFRYVVWRDFDLFWSLFASMIGILPILGVCLSSTFSAFLLVLALPMLAMAMLLFAALRLFWTYWRHDGQALLEVQRAQQLVSYTNQEVRLSFSLLEVESLVVYESVFGRLPSNAYSYIFISLTNQRELYLTCLLCDSIDFRTLLPRVPTTTVTKRFAWLPPAVISRRALAG